jgi:hypothetical protein
MIGADIVTTPPGAHRFFDGDMVKLAFGFGACVTATVLDVQVQPLLFVTVTW